MLKPGLELKCVQLLKFLPTDVISDGGVEHKTCVGTDRGGTLSAK